ncbi:MAG: DNA repair protein RecN [Candidatus Omnitrophica bacterium]|nr:DNA repair protein RecN [Candidatus Omnitrophota bacterium]
MLTHLTIHNFGLIDQVNFEFDSHLNILTGETGAGKSIIIDALRIVLGERLSASQIRDAAKPCFIEAVFELNLKQFEPLAAFEDFLTEGASLIIQRTFASDGKNKIKINGLSATVSQLKEIGDHLIDFHGPHDHQLLLAESQHIRILDRMIDFKETLPVYTRQFSTHEKIKQQLAALKELSHSSAREKDFLEHQVKELSQVPLEASVFESLKQERSKINNVERLSACLHEIFGLFDNEETSPAEIIRQIFRPLRQLNEIDPSTSGLAGLLDQSQNVLSQFSDEIHSYSEHLYFDPQTAQTINDQYDIYENILKKYGPTFAQAQKLFAEVRQKFDLLNNLEHNDQDLQLQLLAAEETLKKSSQELTKKRRKAADQLKSTIEKELSELGIPHVRFDVKIEKTEFHNQGADRVIFYISPNAGEDLKPLADIVSSGEAARVMLALKKALIKVDPIPVLIFDEIDAQIGGRLGSITGAKLREIAQVRQVILITHLPQIAAFADIHLKVVKSVEKGRALTRVDSLDKTARINELAKMMSGEKQTEIAVKHAQDLLKRAKG